MNRNTLKQYAPQARREFIQAVTNRAAFYGLTPNKVEPIIEKGDVAIIGGQAFPSSVVAQRRKLEGRINRNGFDQTMEAMAYTWFNRFVAIRYMELHGYLDHGYRVLSNPDPNKTIPEILEHAQHVELPGLRKDKVIELKLDATKESELYRLLLTAQCNALHEAMPFLFEPIDDETELLLLDNLLHSDSLIRKLVNEIDEEHWQEVEIIGWIYQFYISEKKDQVIGKVVKSEDIPAATQLFTPNWIVKYLLQNTLGRQWLATYPHSPLKSQMEYYIEPAEQTPEVQQQFKGMIPETLNPEELRLLDPAPGSGHILVEAYDLFKAIYQERGYRAKDIPRSILEKNLYGLEICDRSAQLAAFALMMKARADDRLIFESGIRPHVLAIQGSKGIDTKEITEALNAPLESGEKKGAKANLDQNEIAKLIDLFNDGKTLGSLIHVPTALAETVLAVAHRVREVMTDGGMFALAAAKQIQPILEQAQVLGERYEVVVANPPYMGTSGMNSSLKEFAKDVYPTAKADLFAMFVERAISLAYAKGYIGMVTMQSWMFLPSFEKFRLDILDTKTIFTMAHLGARAFSAISGEVVQTTAFVLLNSRIKKFVPVFFRLTDGDEDYKSKSLREGRHRYSRLTQDDFRLIPRAPLAYWLSQTVLALFSAGDLVGSRTISDGQTKTGNNAKYLRYLWEVRTRDIGFGRKWVLHPKGGGNRKWYGNTETLIDWSEPAREHYRRDSVARILPEYLWNRVGVCWSNISTSEQLGFREKTRDEIFNLKSPTLFPKNEAELPYLTGLLNTPIASYLMNSFNPTVSFNVADVENLPFKLLDDTAFTVISRNSERAIEIAKSDWAQKETSWEFCQSPFVDGVNHRPSIAETFQQCSLHRDNAIMEMKALEEENNRLFIKAYGLEGELSSEVSTSQITLLRPDRKEDVQMLISYAVGCIMGRYALDEPGLIYAQSCNNGFDPSQYKTFRADPDGIIPIMETDWFPDDVYNRLVEFVSVAWPKKNLEENLKFIADSLGPNKGEQPRDTICRYLATGFYKYHLSKYKRRPIYWLFTSGEERGFQCLVYLHRYNEGTLSRMRTEYVIPLQGKIKARISQLDSDISNATSTSHRKKLERESDTLSKQTEEVKIFDEKLRHYADMRISLDLDDGVSINYGKFGDLLAEVKTVCGKGEDED